MHPIMMLLLGVVASDSLAELPAVVVENPARFEETIAQIPSEMVGPVWVTFSQNGGTCTIVHVFDESREPYLLITTTGMTRTTHGALVSTIMTCWSGSTSNRTTDRGDDLATVVKLALPYTDAGPYQYLSIMEPVLERYVENYGQIAICVDLNGDVPEWFILAAPFIIE